MAGALVMAAPAQATVKVPVTPLATAGWTTALSPDRGRIKFVQGPGTPKSGPGSVQLNAGPLADGTAVPFATFRTGAFNNVPLSMIAELRYGSYTSQTAGNAAPYLGLQVDITGDRSANTSQSSRTRVSWPVAPTSAASASPWATRGTRAPCAATSISS